MDELRIKTVVNDIEEKTSEHTGKKYWLIKTDSGIYSTFDRALIEMILKGKENHLEYTVKGDYKNVKDVIIEGSPQFKQQAPSKTSSRSTSFEIMRQTALKCAVELMKVDLSVNPDVDPEKIVKDTTDMARKFYEWLKGE